MAAIHRAPIISTVNAGRTRFAVLQHYVGWANNLVIVNRQHHCEWPYLACAVAKIDNTSTACVVDAVAVHDIRLLVSSSTLAKAFSRALAMNCIHCGSRAARQAQWLGYRHFRTKYRE